MLQTSWNLALKKNIWGITAIIWGALWGLSASSALLACWYLRHGTPAPRVEHWLGIWTVFTCLGVIVLLKQHRKFALIETTRDFLLTIVATIVLSFFMPLLIVSLIVGATLYHFSWRAQGLFRAVMTEAESSPLAIFFGSLEPNSITHSSSNHATAHKAH